MVPTVSKDTGNLPLVIQLTFALSQHIQKDVLITYIYNYECAFYLASV